MSKKPTTHEYATVGEALDALHEKQERARRRSLQDVHNEGLLLQQGQAYRRWANVRFAHKPFERLTDDEFNDKYYKRTHRGGKTRRDHERGSWRSRLVNRETRAGYTRWCKEFDSAGAKIDQAKAKQSEFLASCNGKKSRALRA